MEEYEFDKTRKSIRSNELASDDRKDMLQKFRGAGGEVLREKSLRKEEPDSGSGGGRRAGGGSAPDIKMPSELARERNRAQAEKQAAARRQAEREEKEATSFMARFFLKLRCKMGGVTPFGSDMVSPKFLSILNLDAKRAIMECQILGNDLFMNNAKIARTIVKELDDKNPLLVELIQRASELYNRNELSELVGNY
ncbi:MAG: hypothetical protein KDK34_04780, partial [Leptospiraceae bacterium]|nr:hypothetical protein [Leptospiraceae bacterium]